MNEKEEFDAALSCLPGIEVKYAKQSKSGKITQLELKRLKTQRFVFDDDENKEYVRDIDRLLWFIGEI